MWLADTHLSLTNNKIKTEMEYGLNRRDNQTFFQLQSRICLKQFISISLRFCGIKRERFEFEFFFFDYLR